MEKQSNKCTLCIDEYSKELQLDIKLIQSCNNVSHFNAGTTIAGEAKKTYFRFYEKFELKQGTYTSEQLELMIERKHQFRGLVQNAYTEQLRRRSEYVPVSVAGPARYPSQKMDKKVDKLMDSNIEWAGKIERFLANTESMLSDLIPIEKVIDNYRKGKWKYGDQILSDDAYALEKLQAKLEYLETHHQQMKDKNKTAKKEKKQIPYSTCTISNNLQSIKSIKARIQTLIRHRTAKEIEGFNFKGGSVVANYEINRLQLLFEEKPSQEVRQAFRANGFVYSPKEVAWQRQLTENALRAAKQVLNGFDEYAD